MAGKRHFEIQADQIMTEERTFVPNDSSDVPSASLPEGSLQASVDHGKTWIDIDASWDGKGSLDEHREAALKEIKQPGFGAKSDAAKERKKSE